MISIPYNMGEKYYGGSSYLWSQRYFCTMFNRQYTESESCEMEIGVSGPIFTHKIIKGSMGQGYPSSTRRYQNIVVILHFLELEPFPYYSVFTKTVFLSNVKGILAYLNKYSPRKTSKSLWDNDIHTT